MVFVGAQLPVDLNGALVGEDDLGAQTHAAMRHMQVALTAMDSCFPEVVKVNALFTGDWNQAAWGLNVGIRSDYYGKPGPASTGIVAPRLEIEGAMIQAGCIAIAD
jgi:enamine deaminase RidA (YjgF/YER057c/UK114 family)